MCKREQNNVRRKRKPQVEDVESSGQIFDLMSLKQQSTTTTTTTTRTTCSESRVV